MKTQIAVSSLFVITILIVQSFVYAQEGSKGSGGGDIRRSTEQEVRETLSVVIDEPTDYSKEDYNLWVAFFNLSLGDNYKKTVRDPILRKVFDNIMLRANSEDFKTSSIYKDMKNTKLDIKSKGYCKSDSSLSNLGSSTRFELGAPICMSIKRLQNIPKEALKNQVRALFAHEFIHHFGYGEEIANKIQDLFLTGNIGTVDFDAHFANLASSTSSALYEIQLLISNALRSNKTDTDVCVRLGVIREKTKAIESNVKDGITANKNNPNEPVQYAQYWSDSKIFVNEAIFLLSFCGADLYNDPFYSTIMIGSPTYKYFTIPENGNRKQLWFSLQEFRKQLEAYLIKMGGASWWHWPDWAQSY